MNALAVISRLTEYAVTNLDNEAVSWLIAQARANVRLRKMPRTHEEAEAMLDPVLIDPYAKVPT